MKFSETIANRNIARLIFTFILLLFLSLNALKAQWVQTNGPHGNLNMLSAFSHDSILYASAYLTGFFSKNNTSDAWNLNSHIYLNASTVKGDSLFADAHYFAGGISREMGLVLIDLKNPHLPPEELDMNTSMALKHTDSCLFGGSAVRGFFKMLFDGSPIKWLNDGLPTDTIWTPWGTYCETKVTAIELTENHIFAGTNKGVYKSTADLSSWEIANNNLPAEDVIFIQLLQDTLYTAINNNLYYSSDEGNFWSQIYSTPSAITSFLKNGNKLYVSTINDGIFASSDNGTSWSSTNSGLSDLSVNFIIKHHDFIICGTKTEGLFTFADSAWSEDNKGMVSSLIRSMTVVGDKLIANDEQSVYKSDSNGEWIDISPNVNYELFGSVNSMSDTIFLSVEYDTVVWPIDLPFIMYSADFGETWEHLLNAVPSAGDDPYNIYCDSGNLYVYEDGFFYMTDDLGVTWTNLNSPSHVNDFVVFNSILFVATSGNGQIYKRDSAGNWSLTNAGLPPNQCSDLAFCEDAIFTYVSGQGMYVSRDFGDNWSYAGNGLDVSWGIRDFAHYGKHLFVVSENGAFFTSNYGQDWWACNDNLKSLNTSSIKILNDTLFVGTYGNGVWKRAIDEINLSAGKLNNHDLNLTIYPNPASDWLMIENNDYGFEHVRIIDLLGKQVLSENVQSNQINIQHLPNGIYVLYLNSTNEIFTSRLVIKR
jgi:photosystem II stability/assembly factor-like uncharacterized protein